MEHYDSEMAARVWQRVQSDPQTDALRTDVLLLLTEEAKDAALYDFLSKSRDKHKAAILSKLFADSRQCSHVLLGIYRLLTGEVPETASAAAQAVPASLPSCYGNTLRRYTRYEQWSGHKEYGVAFSQLALVTQRRCVQLLQLIGMQGK